MAIGLYCAALLSYELGILAENDLLLIDRMLQNAKLPHRIPKDIELKSLFDLMFFDKKIKNKKLHLILIRQIGQCYIDSEVHENNLMQALKDAVKGG